MRISTAVIFAIMHEMKGNKMKTLITFTISFILLSFIIPNPLGNKKELGYIYLGSGFDNDTVSLTINTLQVLTGEIVMSNKEHNDMTNIYVEMTNDSIFLFKGGTVVLRKPMRLNDKSVKIILTINNHPYSYTMHLNDGKYLFISKHTYYYNVYFDQFKKPVLLY